MNTSDRQLEKLKKLLEVAAEDVATPADLIKLTEAFVDVIARERDRLQRAITDAKGEVSAKLATDVAALSRREQSLRSLVETVRTSLLTDLAREAKQLQETIKRVERKIPSRTDLSGIESQIKAIQEALVTVPTEITANPQSVRDALELLSEDDRLDIGAIRGLENYAELVELMKTVHPSNFNIGKVIRSLRAGSGVTIDVTDPNNPTISSNGGAGSTYETPSGTIDGVNVTFTVSDVPKCVFYYGTPLFEGPKGYSRSGLTITMPYAPVESDQFKAVI
jgi:hypothetical protein